MPVYGVFSGFHPSPRMNYSSFSVFVYFSTGSETRNQSCTMGSPRRRVSLAGARGRRILARHRDPSPGTHRRQYSRTLRGSPGPSTRYDSVDRTGDAPSVRCAEAPEQQMDDDCCVASCGPRMPPRTAGITPR
jgi:hypothetical protein